MSRDKQTAVDLEKQPSDYHKHIDVGHFMMKFITWNIDGLSKEKEFVDLRTKAICERIRREDADVVFLQEVVMESMQYINATLQDYICEFADISPSYFVGTLMKKSTMNKESMDIIPFPNSTMGRGILKIHALFQNIPLTLLNTHLESSKPASRERRGQLQDCFQKVKSEPEDRTVIFAGDMNLRDSEIDIRGVPPVIQDVWITCGQNPEYAYTWDMAVNSNLPDLQESKPQYRFDRVYFSPSYPAKMTPSSFRLIGQEKLPCDRFPSDHWGILCHFEKK